MIARCTLTVLLLLALLSPFGAQAGRLDDCNVVWDSPSADSFGSMPLGNGDVGANVWVEPSGDLLFYVSKVDAFDAGHLLPKFGRVRRAVHPALATNVSAQTLVLRDGAIAIRAGDVDLRVWVDANSAGDPCHGRRARRRWSRWRVSRRCVIARSWTIKADRLAWGYRNTSSAWMERVRSQNTPEFAAKVADPILNRTSGCRLSGEGFVRDGKRALELRGHRARWICRCACCRARRRRCRSGSRSWNSR